MNDKAMQMGALAAECGLDRLDNPFSREEGGLPAQAWQAWDEGYTKAISQWRAARRAEIADQYGDEAADRF
jgi:hypothetical protein